MQTLIEVADGLCQSVCGPLNEQVVLQVCIRAMMQLGPLRSVFEPGNPIDETVARESALHQGTVIHEPLTLALCVSQNPRVGPRTSFVVS